jgi:hypothetical protein
MAKAVGVGGVFLKASDLEKLSAWSRSRISSYWAA